MHSAVPRDSRVEAEARDRPPSATSRLRCRALEWRPLDERAKDVPMTDEATQEGLKQRITRQGEDALGKLAQDVLENPLLNGALTRALDAQKKAAQAQEVAMGALNIPSASDIERLTRRVRSVSQRLEGIEDGLDRLDENLDRAAGAGAAAERLERMEAQLQELARQIAALAEAIPGAAAPVPRNQERMKVGE